MAQITSRPVKVRRLEPFAICALSIHNGCDKRLMRILKPQVYYLNDWIVVEGHEGDETRLNEKRLLDADWYGKYINVQTIVGKNGSGKSSLLDMIYRIVNNFGLALTYREHELNGSNKDNKYARFHNLNDLAKRLCEPLKDVVQVNCLAQSDTAVSDVF